MRCNGLRLGSTYSLGLSSVISSCSDEFRLVSVRYIICLTFNVLIEGIFGNNRSNFIFSMGNLS